MLNKDKDVFKFWLKPMELFALKNGFKHVSIEYFKISNTTLRDEYEVRRISAIIFEILSSSEEPDLQIFTLRRFSKLRRKKNCVRLRIGSFKFFLDSF